MMKLAGGAWLYRLSAWALLSCLLAFAAPYGEQMRLGFAGRLGYWSSVNAMAIVMAVVVREAVLLRFAQETLAVLLSIAVLQAVTLGPAIWFVNIHVFGFDVASSVWLAELVLVVLLAALCVALIRYEVRRVQDFARAQHGGVALPVVERPHRPAFLDQTEDPLPGDVLVVSAADHYLDVVTTEARGRVLMRFRDALIALEDVPGFRIHRSHWVAASEVVRVRPDGRRHLADLRSGAVLPVSDAYVDDLRRADLLSDCAIGKRTGVAPRTIISAPGDINPARSGRSQNSPPV